MGGLASPELSKSALSPETSFFCGQDRVTGARAEAGDTRLGVLIIVHKVTHSDTHTPITDKSYSKLVQAEKPRSVCRCFGLSLLFCFGKSQ